MPDLNRRTAGLAALPVAFVVALLIGLATRSSGTTAAPRPATAHGAIPVARLGSPVRLPGLRAAPASHSSASRGAGSASNTSVASSTPTTSLGGGSVSSATAPTVSAAPSAPSPAPSPSPSHRSSEKSSGSVSGSGE